MMKYNLLFLVSLQLFSIYSGQRVAPGVPPQQYQQQHVPQHQMHQPQHVPQHQMNQVPMQQMNVPVQQQQQQMHHQVPVQHQQPMQQMPVQQQQQQQQQPQQQQQQQPHHAHHHGAGHGQILNAANIAQEKDHIAEHLEVPMDTSKMSEQELQFHYFKMHDADNNNKLDGCELIKSLIHWHGTVEEEENGKGKASQTDQDFSDMIDPLLQTLDKNYDGYVDYAEFKTEME